MGKALCGIAGAFGTFNNDDARARVTESVRCINSAQLHRGPDSTILQELGYRAVLGMTRLAIVGLDNGAQPFASDDGNVSAVFNGEIYNHAELRQRHSLATRNESDGAVIPELYQRFGVGFTSHLRGMYSIAIFDATRSQLILARDPYGIKPLYYGSNTDGVLFFASEPSALQRALPSAGPSQDAVLDFLSFGALGPGVAPDACMAVVDAGGVYCFSAGDPRPVRHTNGRASTILADHARWQDRPVRDIKSAFLDTVEAHLMSDVRVGVLLSGGVDSTALAWAASKLGHRITCVNVDVDPTTSEAKFARATAAELGQDFVHATSLPTADDAATFLACMSTPSIDGLNTWLVSRAVAASGLRVALSGAGGDEAMGGYDHFQIARRLERMRRGPLVAAALAQMSRIPSGLLPGRRGPKLQLVLAARDGLAFSRAWRRLWHPADLLSSGLRMPPEPTSVNGWPKLSGQDIALGEIDHYLSRVLLPDADAFSMCWSVELRVPFVDLTFMAVALRQQRTVTVGKTYFADLLDAQIVQRAARRPKQGFSLPMAEWLRSGPIAPSAANVRSPQALLWSVVDDRLLRRAEVDLAAGHWNKMWSLVVLEAWLSKSSGALL